MKKSLLFIGLISAISTFAEDSKPASSSCVPHFENGQPQGCTIDAAQVNAPAAKPKKTANVYDKLGLKNGDVITEVDGKPISNPAEGIRLHRERKRK